MGKQTLRIQLGSLCKQMRFILSKTNKQATQSNRETSSKQFLIKTVQNTSCSNLSGQPLEILEGNWELIDDVLLSNGQQTNLTNSLDENCK